MQRHAANELPEAARDAGATGAADAELRLLRDVLRLLPAGVTVLDEHGRLVIVNDAAARQLGLAGSGPSVSSQLVDQRREAGLQCLRAGRALVTEEAIDDGKVRQVLLTSHQPVRIDGRDLLISSSADISEQKAFEDQLFRSAYYDELTELPSRRVIEHRANNLLRADGAEKFALAFLDIDNFKQINDYYGHGIGDALLIELARRICRELRDSDMLSRISGDEFLLLLSPVQSQVEVAEFLT